MGTKYSIKLKNGTEFIGILGDAKADQHTTTSSQHAQHITDKSVIEFEMACGSTIDPKHMVSNLKEVIEAVVEECNLQLIKNLMVR